VFVTHDQEEALELADRVAILDRGRIGQVARRRTSTSSRHRRPSMPSSARSTHPRHRGRAGPAGGRAARPLPEHAGGMAGEAEVFIRPEDVQIDGDAPGWEAVVVSGRQTGARHRLRARLLETGDELDIDLSAQAVRSGLPADGVDPAGPVRYGVSLSGLEFLRVSSVMDFSGAIFSCRVGRGRDWAGRLPARGRWVRNPLTL
jgi:sulfate transport system ATP-binding protein